MERKAGKKQTKRNKRERSQSQIFFPTCPAYLMTKRVQWNYNLRARQEEVRLLRNRHQPSCICLQEVMLENKEYNLGQEYEFHAMIPLGGRSTLQVIALSVYLVGREKRTICSIYLPSTDQVTEEDIRDLLEQLPAPMILLGDFNAHNPL